MSDKTGIEWTNATWNPTRGCSRVSPGCTGCYAERVAMRFSGPGQPYEGLVKMVNGSPTWTGKMLLAENKLTLPLTWKTGRMVFVDSMSDLFHVGVPFSYIDKVFAMMAMCPQHSFQVLTKRPDRMLEYITSRSAQIIHEAAKAQLGYDNPKRRAVNYWPLPNVWLGVSAENQDTANERIPLLLRTPAAIRWVSAEPLLGPIDLNKIELPGEFNITVNAPGYISALTKDHEDRYYSAPASLDWVVAGGESGPKARPFDLRWARRLRDQCAASGTPFLWKQHGEWFPTAPEQPKPEAVRYREWHGGFTSWRVTKKRAGRLLDGVEHNGYPVAA